MGGVEAADHLNSAFFEHTGWIAWERGFEDRRSAPLPWFFTTVSPD